MIRHWIWKGFSTSVPISGRSRTSLMSDVTTWILVRRIFLKPKYYEATQFDVLYILKLAACFVMLIYYSCIHLRSKFCFITAEPYNKVNISLHYWGWPTLPFCASSTTESKISFYHEYWVIQTKLYIFSCFVVQSWNTFDLLCLNTDFQSHPR
jgi:hypothetical protein